jgi:UDP-N-acetylmuramoylalanine--D-glutamate ligase
VLPIARARTMQGAVELAQHLAHCNDAVLLSPACSSFDMFRDYRERGEVFVRAVHSLASHARAADTGPSRGRKVSP